MATDVSAYGLNYDPNYSAAPNLGKSSIDYGTTDSSGNPKWVGQQFNTYHWIKAALVDAAKERFFTQLADTTYMPKHFGKKIVRYHYLPLLDERNVNDQGIDASGKTVSEGGINAGNLYGSSRDIGTITAQLPTIGENGGRVNRVGFSRVTVEGTFSKYGMFYDFSQESLDLDTDNTLMAKIAHELIVGANKIYENALNIDLVAAAGVVQYAGSATSLATMTATASAACVVTYNTLRRIDQILTENQCPRSTKVVLGSTLTDTKTIPAARIAYVGSEVVPLLEDMVDKFNNPCFIPVQRYGAATKLVHGEVGTIGHFRFVEVPDAVFYATDGATVPDTGDQGYRTATKTVSGSTETHFSVFPILFVGSGSFTTISFSGQGQAKFKILTKMPGRETSTREHDPYGQNGFSSIMWYYGFAAWRPEWIAVAYTLAPQ